MRAVVCKAFGPPEDLVVESVDDPVPGPGQLLVDVAAAAVVFPDTLMLQDKYQYKATPPYIPGGEVAGVVVGVGERADGWSIGDRVLGALGATGGYAELCAIPAASARSTASHTGSSRYGCSTGAPSERLMTRIPYARRCSIAQSIASITSLASPEPSSPSTRRLMRCAPGAMP